MAISKAILQKLALKIVQNIKEEFEIKHLSKNLINTIQVVESNSEISIIIPAETYDMLLYLSKGVVVHKGRGSYASQLDKEGSKIAFGADGKSKKVGNHVGYVERAINKAINEVMAESRMKISKKEVFGNE